MSSECLSFTRIPHTTHLFNDFLYNFDRVSSFYARPPRASDWVADEVGRISYDQQRRVKIADILERQNRRFEASQSVFDSIDRFRNGALAAVTGQQVGLLGGPLFSILKALSAVRLAEQVVAAGSDCVPIFWLATDDHDFDEIRSAVLLDRDGALHTLTLEADHTPGAPVRDVRLDQRAAALVEEAAALLGDEPAADLIRQAYAPGQTIGAAFARMFTRLFAEYGVIMLDASDPELHGIAAPLYAEAISGAEELARKLLARGKDLQGAGYHEQVKVTSSSTLLFGMADGIRVPIHRANGQFELAGRKLSADELKARIADNPGHFSPNVLLRPVVQDYLLPTVAYAGGPAEVAYFAQAAVVYDALLGRRTPILPRFSATVVDARAKRVMERYGLQLTDMFEGPEHVTNLLAARSLPENIGQAFDHGHSLIDQAVGGVSEPLNILDPTLVRSAARAANKMRYQFERLRKRAAAASLRRDEILKRHAAHLNSTLFPHKDLQERVISGISFVARYGPALLPALYEAAQNDCLDHQVIYI